MLLQSVEKHLFHSVQFVDSNTITSFSYTSETHPEMMLNQQMAHPVA